MRFRVDFERPGFAAYFAVSLRLTENVLFGPRLRLHGFHCLPKPTPRHSLMEKSVAGKP
jgi:hypothetical protein